MHAHYLQHVPFEGPGSIEPALTAAGYTLGHTRFFETAALPDPRDIDLLVVMGGPMSVNDEQEFPWLIAEKKFIRAIIEAGKPVLGICLGAQLIASAMGARIYKNKENEIGWFPVEGVTAAGMETFAFPEKLEVFHWHGETFDLPPGATRLARSGACENQAFQLGARVIGLQFHLEMNPGLLRTMIEGGWDELATGRYVQTEPEILAAAPGRYQAVNRVLVDLLDYLRRPL
ncbi:MAG TPA: gamma-glutamyl-gamma-aminobutyrate hydrolase family protein [Gammaproteobacteria bacterium]|nr:gamma-glutamyl-gamma-aminobutyrate hydrolase family protein [Gammaproteobacteria bacterium]